MKTFLISDTHLNHSKIATYCDRPENFTEIILNRWNQRVTPADTVIHLGDVAIGKKQFIAPQIRQLNGRKILVRGNHDQHGSVSWWMDNGFDFACDALAFRGLWLTHHPARRLPYGCILNIHGHLHNLWNGFHPNGGKNENLGKNGALDFPWQRLFAIEYTNYFPIEIDEFVDHPDKYQSRKPKEKV